VTRLLDRIVGREPRHQAEQARADFSTLAMMYATPDAERLLPQFEYFAANAYAGNSVVFSLIGKRLALFSEATFKFRQLKTKRLFGTDALAKLENPWPNGSTGELLARMEQDVSLAGNCYIRNAGTRLERLRPDWVTIISVVQEDATGEEIREVIGYWFEPLGDTARKPAFYDVSEVAHWSPIPDPLANFRGMSWLTPVIREIDADVSMSRHRDAFFRNAATPQIAVKYQQKLKQTQRDDIRDAIGARHAGADNAFGTMVLDQGADLTVVGANMEGAAFTALQAAGELRIASASGVPPHVAGMSAAISSGVPRPGELADDMRLFADGLLRPNWRTACAALATLVQVPSGAKLWFDTSDISALRQGETDAATTMQLNATTANTLIMAGYDPDAVIQAISSGDVSLLIGAHSGLTSVQMQPPKSGNDPETAPVPQPTAAPDQPAGGTDATGTDPTKDPAPAAK
jgi:phage portal protein BeeE